MRSLASLDTKHHRGAYAKGDSGGSTTKVEALGYTSPQQYLQPDGAAPCADGLAWGFDGEGFDNGNFVTHADKNPAKVGGKLPATNLPQDDRDTGTDVGLVSMSTAGTVRYPFFRILASQQRQNVHSGAVHCKFYREQDELATVFSINGYSTCVRYVITQQ